MKTIEQKAQNFALGQVLSEWEEDLSYDDILAVLESEDPDENECDDGGGWRVIAWEPYENDEPWQIAQTIRDMVRDLVELFGDMENENKDLRRQLISACNALMEIKK